MRTEYVKLRKGMPLHDVIAAYVRETVDDCGGCVRAAAKSLQIVPQTVVNRLGVRGYRAAARRRRAA